MPNPKILVEFSLILFHRPTYKVKINKIVGGGREFLNKFLKSNSATLMVHRYLEVLSLFQFFFLFFIFYKWKR